MMLLLWETLSEGVAAVLSVTSVDQLSHTRRCDLQSERSSLVLAEAAQEFKLQSRSSDFMMLIDQRVDVYTDKN